MADVSVAHLTKTFGATKALDDVTVTFPDGQFFGLLGPSGSGKTTLLRAIAGFIFCDAGTVRIGDVSVESIAVERRDIGMVFQSYALFPNMTVADNVGFGLRVRGATLADERRKVGEALELVQLMGLGGRKPHELSGGQRQRVAMARAIAPRPKVLLLDEPLSALDKSLRVDMQVELKRIQRDVGITTIFVTHDQEEALTLSDQIGILKDGAMVQTGAPRDVYHAPRNAFAAQFLGDANILTGVLEPGGLRLADGTWLQAATAQVAVRPEAMTIVAMQPAGPALQARLQRRVFAGAMATCLLDWQGQTIKVLARDQDIPQVPDGAQVWVTWDADKTLALAE
jgi:putative spermidine/putrescine transport system ATP-binding protein